VSANAVHPVLLRGPSFSGSTRRAPLLLHRTEDEFIPAVLSELSQETSIPALLRTTASFTDSNRRLKLFHPVQRAFHVALLEIVCDRLDYPRFDPANIVSAGLVVRRVRREQARASGNGKSRGVLDGMAFDRHDVLEGWRRDGAIVQGWVPFAGQAEEDLDPDLAFRRVVRYGHDEVDTRLAALRSPTARMSESSTPLFPAPPEVAHALKKTILFGVVPVASAEVSKAATNESFPGSQVRERLSLYLRSTSMQLEVPYATSKLAAGDLSNPTTRDVLAPYVNMLRQLVFELDAFGDSAESKALFTALNRFSLPYGTLRGKEPRYRVPAGTSMRQHAEVLVHRKGQPTRLNNEEWPDYPAVVLPNTWPKIDAATGDAIVAAAKLVLDKRLPAIKGEEPRYAEKGRLYRVRAFARVAHEGECVHTVWSDYSDPFTIAPWYEGFGAPTAQVSLPSLDELASLAKKPNVTFKVPGDLANLMQQNDPVEMLKGNIKKGSGIGIEFLCSMSIPVITFCAFIVLNIFLGLLNLIFMWMLWPIVMCIPIPSAASAPPEPQPPTS
jgi:hypothetical protein